MTGDTSLETLQADVLAVLNNCPELADANLMAQDEGDMESRITQKLGTLSGGGTSKTGLVIVVKLPEATTAERNLPGPPVGLAIEVQVIEQPKINRGSSGTGLRSSVAALRVLGALHLRGLGNMLLYAGEDALRPLDVKPGYLSHLVKLTVPVAGLGLMTKANGVSAAFDGGTGALALTCAGASAIWYTFDGTYPEADNRFAYKYTAPFFAPTSLQFVGVYTADGVATIDAPGLYSAGINGGFPSWSLDGSRTEFAQTATPGWSCRKSGGAWLFEKWDGGTLVFRFRAVSAAATPDLVPAGPYDPDTNPEAWQPDYPATGTPVAYAPGGGIDVTLIRAVGYAGTFDFPNTNPGDVSNITEELAEEPPPSVLE